MACYIRKENKKAYDFLTKEGYKLKPAYKVVTLNESYIEPKRPTGSYMAYFDDDSLIIADYEIYVVENYPYSDKAFHKLLKENNLLYDTE